MKSNIEICDYVQLHMGYKNSSFENRYGLVINTHMEYGSANNLYDVYVSSMSVCCTVSCFWNELELIA
jgi:hypothetical protein